MEWRDCDKSEFSRVNKLSLLNYYVSRVYAVQNFQSSLEFFGLFLSIAITTAEAMHWSLHVNFSIS